MVGAVAAPASRFAFRVELANLHRLSASTPKRTEIFPHLVQRVNSLRHYLCEMRIKITVGAGPATSACLRHKRIIAHLYSQALEAV